MTHAVTVTAMDGLFGGTLYKVVCGCGWATLATEPQTAEQYKAAHLEDLADE